MEMFGAADEDQWEIIKKDIDESDYYVLIIGKCFGSEVPGEGISYTQKEFRYAVSQGIPVLAFLMREDTKVPKTFYDTDKDKIKKLKDFRKEVEDGRTVSYWSTPDELPGQVISSLERQIKRKPRPGWVRASEFDIEKSHAELIELTEKVRTLEEENTELLQKAGEKREPRLAIQTLSPVVIHSVDPAPIPDLKEWYRKIGMKDAEKLGVTRASIARYNKSLPTESEINEMSDDLQTRAEILAGYSWLDLIVRNTGTSRATNITVDIEVPEELHIYETIDLPMLTDIHLPKHEIRGEEVWLEGLSERKNREEFPERVIRLPGINGWDIVENRAEITIDEIRHYSAKRCIEFFIVGNKPGTYSLNCKIMCAEYKEPISQQLRVSVVRES